MSDGMEARDVASWRRALALVLVLGGAGCSLDGLLNSDEVPPNLSDPAATETPQGARNAYYGTLATFRAAWGIGSNVGGIGSVVADVGILTDELAVSNGSNIENEQNESLLSIDQRTVTGGYGASYGALQWVRGQAAQAIGLLTRYLPDEPALVGHLYVLQGYAEVLLAELYCSGIPLSTLDFGGDFTYRPGSRTEDVFTHAVALFDTALALAGDSARIMQLAQLGKGRALMSRGEYAAAVAAVGAVPDGYRYHLSYSNQDTATGLPDARNFLRPAVHATTGAVTDWDITVADREGVNGLDWRSSGDPRVPLTSYTVGSGVQQFTFYFPSQYAIDGSSPLVLASGVEARLIEAEAQLAAGSGAWLATLNALRTDGTFEVDTQVVAVDTNVNTAVDPPDTTYDTTFAYDTTWHAGSGGVDGLAPLEDPGLAEGRVDLLFRERGFWLFLTGHRLGDLRRLIRQYGRSAVDLYPVGSYPFTGFPYGSAAVFQVPETEIEINPLYAGCFTLGA